MTTHQQAESSVGKAAALDDQQVAEYLLKHQDFFQRNEHLLTRIHLPHASGKAISLVERQLNLFREQRDDSREKLSDLIRIARENDRLFEKSKRLLLGLLEAQSLDELSMVLEDSIRNDFQLDFCHLLLFGRPEQFPITNVRMLPQNQVQSVMEPILKKTGATCGQLSAEQNRLLFQESADVVGSAAIIPLVHDDTYGVLSLASREADYFHPTMGSLFLSYVSDAISRLLPALLRRERSERPRDAHSV